MIPAFDNHRDRILAEHGSAVWCEIENLARELVAFAMNVTSERVSAGRRPTYAANIGAYAALVELAAIAGLELDAAMLAAVAVGSLPAELGGER